MINWPESGLILTMSAHTFLYGWLLVCSLVTNLSTEGIFKLHVDDG